ncbi:phytanoyl-CoA dioxygenase family protein [Noviherbaspirillum cavernae]|uniref:Phytanoyl-CoA dioxygenase family protein n=1 Tax=Noviherbaspirillum cavernae TaxID=2320862 RepID=A0A418X6R5_9BURK|nr:phytanoyl-CoA dioxygenase family protein [Noviherbaspirillum cavernae]RJG08145.1 phytanoyl-CoA dioxygenase family protein [Noviherbaspirillum cavernae]
METALTDTQLTQFKHDGYLIFRNMATPAACAQMSAVTAEHLQQAVPPLEYEAEVGYPGAPSSLDAPGGRTARRLRDAWHRHECFRAWAGDRRIVTHMEQIFGERACLALAHHNCVMTKHPHFGTATGWHRDIRYWSFARNDLVTVWLALGTETEGNGALQVIPGSHRLDIQRSQLDELDFLRPDVEENQALFRQGITLELQQGDVLFFHSGLFHSAGTNDSDAVKTSVVFAYRGASNLPREGSRSAAAGDVPLGAD